ncbi:MAG: HAD-IIIC family phosphatase, partial [bacterium]|nr:HAD-IIIC family phosphatase [bacterium]
MEKNFNIALLSSFTARPIEAALRTACKEAGISCDIYLGGYNQYAQEILNSQSGLYASNQDLVIVFVDTRALFGENFFVPYGISDEARKEFGEEKFQEIIALVECIKKNSTAKVLLNNFEIPTHSPMGILENKQAFGFFEAIEVLDANLREQFKSDSRVFLFDYERFCARLGKERVFDHKMYYLGDIKLNPQCIPALAKEYVGYVKAFMGRAKKCLVLDCDNTLWGGVIGEDGIESIRLGPTPEGRPFLEFQKYLLSLFQRGIVLALNSKNNHDDVMKVLREHPHMVLKEEHFAATRINWDDKVANMRALANELNLGMDSFVFIDDEHMNRDMMRQMLPEISVVELPDDPALYVITVSELDDFHTLAITDEDRKRGNMYVVDRQRKEVQNTATDLNEYLRNLQTVVTLERANSMTIPRIAQLTAKTNQFNMTTRRYTEEQVAGIVDRPDFLIVSLSVRDRFGDSGT